MCLWHIWSCVIDTHMCHTHTYVSMTWHWSRLVSYTHMGLLQNMCVDTQPPHMCLWHICVYDTRRLQCHVTCVEEFIHMCDVTHSYVWRDSFICVTRLIHMCDVTQSYVWRDSVICVTWLSHKCDVTQSYVWRDSVICVTRVMHTFDMTHSHVWHDLCICVTWLIHMCDTTHAYVWHDSSICVTRLIHMCDMTQSYVLPLFCLHLDWSVYGARVSVCVRHVWCACKCACATSMVRA